ncbi:MAG: hypothetical protein CHACPFDD_02829 [Phycisphaerae bacterium]|nr:hypothetical protein [Phycisphaerae bacterium]
MSDRGRRRTGGRSVAGSGCGARLSRSAATVTTVLLSVAAGGAQTTSNVSDLADEPVDLVRTFDFNERPLGNFNDTPMNWEKLHGVGLPAYSRGRFDDQVGCLAPPSFRMDLRGGSVCYAYQRPEFTIEADSDYLIVGQVMASGLQHARAFISAAFVDRFGQRIDGSSAVSELAATETGWQPLRVVLRGNHPEARSIRIELWVAQSFVWRDTATELIDPIVRQDVQGQVWFDDIEVFRLPRLRFRFAAPTGLVRASEPAVFLLEVQSNRAKRFDSELTISDAAGAQVRRQEESIPSTGGEPHAIRTPPLPPGAYTATIRLLANGQQIAERSIAFASIIDLERQPLVTSQFGVDVPVWTGGDVAAAAELVAELDASLVRLAIAVDDGAVSAEQTRQIAATSELARRLARERIESAGVLVTRTAADDARVGQTTRAAAANEATWRMAINGVMMHVGGLLTTWQLGDELIESRDVDGWDDALVAAARTPLLRFLTSPRIVVPGALTRYAPSRADIVAVGIPAILSARHLASHLEFLAESDQAHWLSIEAPDDLLRRDQRLADLARKTAIAAALDPQRLFVRAPFTAGEGGAGWQPSEEYVILRTLFHALAGKRAVGVLTPDADTVAILYSGQDGKGCAVLWSWLEGNSRPSDLYLGSAPRLRDLWGVSRELLVNEGRVRLVAPPVPVIIENVQAPLALAQASFTVSPTELEAHRDEPRPVVRFRNHFDQDMVGVVSLEAPSGWQVVPQTRNFTLAAGETLTQELQVGVPPRQVSGRRDMRVTIQIESPAKSTLRFEVPLTLGLQDITFDVGTYWVDDALVIEQRLRNGSSAPVSFWGFAQAPGRARVERAFLEVAPGDHASQTLQIPRARGLAGRRVHVGIREISGPRSLDQLIDIPQ